MTNEEKKKFVNRKHDLDYAASVAFADGIATNETNGEMSRFIPWMYGQSKICLSISQVRNP